MARFDKQALLRRVLSAAVLIPFTLWVIWTGKHMFSAFCIIGALLSFYEWRALVAKLKHSWVYLIAGAAYITLGMLGKERAPEDALVVEVLTAVAKDNSPSQIARLAREVRQGINKQGPGLS